MPAVIVVRHGSTAWNKGGSDTGDGERIRSHADLALDHRGRAETARLAEDLKDEPIDSVVASDLKPAAMTARRIADTHHATVKTTPGLRTWNLGELQGKVATKDVTDKIANFVRHPDDVPAGGESFQTFAKRFLATFSRTLDEAKQTTLVVAHGRNIQMIPLWLESGQDRMAMYRAHSKELAADPGTVAHGGYIRLEKTNGAWRVTDTHLPQHKVPVS